ncbi:MAG: hypothetical protein ABI743_12350, partial [bacterium]
NENSELESLRREIFYRGDYDAALRKLDNEISSNVSQADKDKIRSVIMGLVMNEIVNAYVAGLNHMNTTQYEAARANWYTITRMHGLFADKDMKTALPDHPRLGGQTVTVGQALEMAEKGVDSCNAILEGRPDPNAPAKPAKKA